MKKKIVSLLMAVLMIAGCFATVTTPASAMILDYYEGESAEIYLSGFYSEVPSSGNIKNIRISDYSTGSAAITFIGNDEYGAYVQVDCIEYGKIEFEYEEYSEESGWFDNDYSFAISPVMLAGEERTFHFYNLILSSANGEYHVQNIESENTSYATITDISAVGEDELEITVRANRAGYAPITFDECFETLDGYVWEPDRFFTICISNPTKYLTADSSSVALDQDYQLEVYQEYVDTTRVKLDWELDEICASYTSTKTWNAIDLKWDEVKSEADAASVGAEFKLTNYSSEKIYGHVSFATVEDEDIAATLADATFENNGLIIDTMVNSDRTIDEDKKANAPSNTITAELEFDAENFYELAATEENEKYGTYTVTIGTGKEVTFEVATYFASQIVITTENTVTLYGATWGEAIENNNHEFTVTAELHQGDYKIDYTVGLYAWGKSVLGIDCAWLARSQNSPVGLVLYDDITTREEGQSFVSGLQEGALDGVATADSPLESGTYYIFVGF